MKRFLSLTVYSDTSTNYDCTNGGVSSPENKHRLFIESPEGNYILEDLKSISKKEKVAVLYVDSKRIGTELYENLKPYEFNENFELFKSLKHHMFGGNFAWSSDSRVRSIMKYPLPIHDRVE